MYFLVSHSLLYDKINYIRAEISFFHGYGTKRYYGNYYGTMVITEQRLHEKRQNNYLKQKACKTGNLNDWEKYKHTRNNYNKLIKNTIKSHFSNDIQNNKGNLKKTWKSINQCLNRNPKSNKIVLIKDTNEQDIKSEDMANAFNEHFINIGSNLAQLIPQTNYPPEYYINSVDKIFTFPEITEEEVLIYTLTKHVNQ